MIDHRCSTWEKEDCTIPIEGAAFDRGTLGKEVPRIDPLSYKLNPSTNNCKCCVHPDIEEVDRLFLTDEISGKEAAERLEVSPTYYSIHIHRDVQRIVKEEVTKSPVVQDAIQATIDKVSELRDIFALLVDRAKLLLNAPLDAKAEFRIKAIASEARAYGEFLMKVEGELKDSPLIVINQLNVQFQRVIELVMEEAPMSLKKKLAEQLKEMNLNAWL